MDEVFEVSLAGGLGTVLALAFPSRQSVEGFEFLVGCALGSAVFAAALRTTDAPENVLPIVAPIILAAGVLGAALAATAPSLRVGLPWAVATIAAGAAGALAGADRLTSAVLVTLLTAAVGMALRRSFPCGPLG